MKNDWIYNLGLQSYRRICTQEVAIGETTIGGQHPIALQSMTTTDTMDTNATVQQSLSLARAGSDFVRISAPSIRHAENLKNIRDQLKSLGCSVPLIADIHFTPHAAEVAARIVEKVRINPGNYVDRKRFVIKEYSDKAYNREIEVIYDKFSPLIKICKEHGTAMRIGSNHGSLSDRIMGRYGDTPEGMVESALEFVRICEDHNYFQIVLSMKASNTQVMVQSYRLLMSKMLQMGRIYPIHLGVTEAGFGIDGRLKSASGIGSLLLDGIGDTIRVSLTEAPENEIPVARSIVNYFNIFPQQDHENHCEFSEFNSLCVKNPFVFQRRETDNYRGIGGDMLPCVIGEHSDAEKPLSDFAQRDNFFYRSLRTRDDIYSIRTAIFQMIKDNNKTPVVLDTRSFVSHISQDKYDPLITEIACALGPLLLDGLVDAVIVPNQKKDIDLMLSLFQATRLRSIKTDYISCPSCARTLFDLESVSQKVREKTSHLKDVKIAIMGCIVNGPGEMADADYGYVGSGVGKISLYRKHNVVIKNIKDSDAVHHLIDLIQSDGRWQDPS